MRPNFGMHNVAGALHRFHTEQMAQVSALESNVQLRRIDDLQLNAALTEYV